jgi:NADH:ubiquinone oxidoreductase subunit E
MFSSKPKGKHLIRVCDSLPCRVCGSVDIYLYLQDKLGIRNGETTPDGMFSLEVVNCLGACSTAPNIMINDENYGNMVPEKIDSLLSSLKEGAHA